MNLEPLSPPTTWLDRIARRSLVWGIGGSVLLHLIAFSVMAVGEIHGWIVRRPLPEIANVGRPPVRSATVAPPVHVPSFTLVKSPPAEVSSSMVQARLDEIVNDANRKSTTDNLNDLDRLTRRLDTVSERSVDDLARQFQSWMGLEGRSTEAVAAKSLDEFDSDSAQLDDVERTEKPDGGWKYVGRLIDKHGRTIDVELGEVDGRAAYELMQKLKSNPLLEKIYRQIAMPLIDAAVKPKGTAIRATPGAETPPHRANIGGPADAVP